MWKCVYGYHTIVKHVYANLIVDDNVTDLFTYTLIEHEYVNIIICFLPNITVRATQDQ